MSDGELDASILGRPMVSVDQVDSPPCLDCGEMEWLHIAADIARSGKWVTSPRGKITDAEAAALHRLSGNWHAFKAEERGREQ